MDLKTEYKSQKTMRKYVVIGFFLASLIIWIICAGSVVAINLWIDGIISTNPHIIAIPFYFVMLIIVLHTLRNIHQNMFSLIDSIRDFINESIYVVLGISTLLLLENPDEFNRTHVGILLFCIGVYQFIGSLIRIMGSFCSLYIERIDGHKIVLSRNPKIHKDALYLITPQTAGFYHCFQVSENINKYSQNLIDPFRTPKKTFFNFTQILNFNRIASAYTFIRLASVIDNLPNQSVVDMYEHCMKVMTISYMFYLLYNFVLMVGFTLWFGSNSYPKLWTNFKKNLWIYFVMSVLSVRYIGMVKFYYGFFHYLVDMTNNNFMFFLMPMIFVMIIVSIVFLIGISINNRTIIHKIEKHVGPLNPTDYEIIIDSDSDDASIQYSQTP